MNADEVLEHCNSNLADIITPVKAEVLRDLLKEVNYDESKTEFLYKGFAEGFSLNFEGNTKVRKYADSLQLRVGSKLELWNKVMLEVEKKRYAGPSEEVPYEYFVQSLIGLVPKDKGTKTRLIFHLSYPKKRESVNAGIPKDVCSVQYPDFDEAIQLCIQAGKGCFVRKSDMASAFRHVPMNKSQWFLLIMKAEHPLTRKIYFLVDKCLPFGSSISCAIFQEVSNGIAFLVQVRIGKRLVNYLDDYLFAAYLRSECNEQIKIFLVVCRQINFPVSMEKTFWATQYLTFLGLLLDTVNQVVCITLEKVNKALELIEGFLCKKKATILMFQKLCGTLNFLCKCVISGKVFVRRLYAATENNNLKPHHHVRISAENKADLSLWQEFLRNPAVFCRPFLDSKEFNSLDIGMFSDASRNFKLGFRVLCGEDWTFGQWCNEFMTKYEPSIEYLELFAVTVAIIKWIKWFPNKRILLYYDNESVVWMINKTTSKCRYCMVLLQMIVLEALKQNVRIKAAHVRSEDNGRADALSRLDLARFWRLSAEYNTNEKPSEIPDSLWPLDKIWLR